MGLKDACKKLQEKGLKFELYCAGSWVFNTWDFTSKIEDYRIAAQPIPDREDWREWCRRLQDCGVIFEMHHAVSDTWSKWKNGFCFSERPIKDFRIPAQPIPAGIPKYLESEMAEQKQDKPEIPHLEQQIQWHEDKLHSLKTGEPMREWQYKNIGGYWFDMISPCWFSQTEYRRKPRTVTYWTFVMQSDGKPPEAIIGYILDEAKHLMRHYKELYPSAKFGPITETTVEMED